MSMGVSLLSCSASSVLLFCSESLSSGSTVAVVRLLSIPLIKCYSLAYFTNGQVFQNHKDF